MDEKKVNPHTKIFGGGVKILVVDDLEIVCEHLKFYFERHGYSVFTAGSAEEALPIIKAESPRIMLLDINLPGMSGIELLRAVRQFNKTIKVIMVSGYDIDFKIDPRFQGLDVFEFMLKPVGIAELEATIKKIIHKL